MGGLPFQWCYPLVIISEVLCSSVVCSSVVYSAVQCGGTNLFSSSKSAGLGWRKPCSDMVTGDSLTHVFPLLCSAPCVPLLRSVALRVENSADTRHRTPDTGHQTPDTGHQTPVTRHGTPDNGHQTPALCGDSHCSARVLPAGPHIIFVNLTAPN